MELSYKLTQKYLGQWFLKGLHGQQKWGCSAPVVVPENKNINCNAVITVHIVKTCL